MFKKYKNKLVASLAALTCAFACGGVCAQTDLSLPAAEQAKAETSTESSTIAPEIEIVSKNLSYADSVYILYAVSWNGFDESQNEVKMLFWNEPQTAYTVETAQSVKRAEYVTTLGERECIVFYSDGIAAKEMTDAVYCRAYTEIDGTAYYSETDKYSVLDYVYERKASSELTEYQAETYTALLEYGAATQKLFGYRTERLANGTFYTVTVENGTLSDGFTWGRYALNETATLTANAPADGEECIGWVDETDETVAETATLTVTVTADKTYTATYETAKTPVASFEYEIVDNSTVTITKYIGEYTDVRIPSKIEMMPVTTIGSESFKNCTVLTSVVVPDSVTCIAASAFSGCANLNQLTLPFVGAQAKSVSCLNQYPLGYVFGSTSYVGGVATKQKYYGSPFYTLTETTYYIPQSLTHIEITGGEIAYGAFYNCSYLTNVKMDSDVIGIGDNAFRGCTNLEKVELGSGVNSIGYMAFYQCENLSSIEIPNGVTNIEDYSFAACSNLTTAEIGEQVTNIGASAFYGCESLGSVVIPDSVTSIGIQAFRDCSALMTVEVGNAVSSIGDAAFSGCSLLKNVTLPESIVDMGGSAFWNCENLLFNEYNNAYYLGNEYNKYVALISAVSKDITDCAIHEKTKIIAGGAFYNCKSLISVVLTSEIVGLGDSAFYNCSELTSVVFGDSITRIGNTAFYYCSRLSSVEITDTVEEIGDSAFMGCGLLKDLTIGNGLKKICKSAFKYCSTLSSVTFSKPNGWQYATSSTAASGFTIDSTALSDPTTAATYLTDTYDDYYWKRSE